MKFFDKLNLIDKVIDKETPDNAILSIKEYFSNIEILKYFFSKLNNPEWIEPLKQAGLFNNLPDVKHIDKYIQIPKCPQTQYLARMASLVPKEVNDILIDIETDNSYIQEDYIDALLNMPVEYIPQHINKIKKWIDKKTISMFLPEKSAKLMLKLAKSNKDDEAIKLGKLMLNLTSSNGFDDLKPKIDVYEHETILKKDIPQLIEVLGFKAFEMLCDILESLTKFYVKKYNAILPDDYSNHFRPAIEEHEQNNQYSSTNHIISTIRSAAEQLIENKQIDLKKLVDFLDNKEYRIFHRFSIHFLRIFKDKLPEQVKEHLLNKNLFFSQSARHEYVLLLKECYELLSQNEQETILSWIKNGPVATNENDCYSEKDIRYWQLKHLIFINEHLPSEWQKIYNNLVNEFGKPEHPEFEIYITSWVGPTSPIQEEDLQKMSTDEVINYLQSWKPKDGTFEDSKEGLGQALSSVIAKEPEKLLNAIEKIKYLEPTYVYSFLNGLNNAIKHNKSFDWENVIQFCEHEINHFNKNEEKYKKGTSPGMIYNAIISLLSNGLRKEQVISFKYRKRIWNIIELLTDDPDPTPQQEKMYGGDNMDPPTLCINTVRGNAMHLLGNYALWIRRYLEKLPDAKERLKCGFNEMPEVRDVLNKHLDISYDPSLAIRSFYGQFFPWLNLLDSSWALENSDKILPTEKDLNKYWHAAWDTYIVFCQPYDNTFKILRNKYKFAIEHFGEPSQIKSYLANPEDRLAEHLMVFYWRGKINLDNPNNLFELFWSKAPDNIRQHALEFIGRTLNREKNLVNPKVKDLVKVLWEKRVNIHTKHPEKFVDSKELAAFGWWFVSEVYDKEWSLSQLLIAIKDAKEIDYDLTVVKKLAEYANEFPELTIRCLDELVRNAESKLKITVWGDEAMEIMTTAIKSGNIETVMIAKNLANYLGSLGFLEFREVFV